MDDKLKRVSKEMVSA